MLRALRAFMKNRATWTGILAAFMFQLVFGVVWMTGYDGVTDRTANLKVAVVNEDQEMGSLVVDRLGRNLPFGIVTVDLPEQAMNMLNDRDVQMVLHIPPDFSSQLQVPGGQASLKYWINESNPSMIKSIMQSVASQVTAAVDKQAIAAGAEAILTPMNVPADRAKEIAAALSERVVSDIRFTNPVQGMANQMLPMMMVLASYVGSMIMAMNIQQSSQAIGSAVTAWQKFGARAVINVVSAIVIALFAASLILMLGGQANSGFMALWGFLSLILMSFMFFAQLFLLLFGFAGMLFNITALSAQLVSSGAMVPRELLSGFYRHLGDWLPATYAVEGSMNLLFGGSSPAGPAWLLAAFAAGSLALGAVITALRSDTGRTNAPAAETKLA
ncbi:ABC transporter [Paenibacillus sp. 32O-W]|uniref:YhgE/Pip domain-containing protein n=1 Tax=Paenibacillus sp. 32O-W TaxID=1695218 RepID=UPI000721F2F0|nr:ABC transporter permease [Paenibacillus sp. 32O-W]ALS28420.1 ABC transporter [Paenibacillus sp. 32O-W]